MNALVKWVNKHKVSFHWLTYDCLNANNGFSSQNDRD